MNRRKVWVAILLSSLGYSSLLYVGRPRTFLFIAGCGFALILGVMFGFPPGFATPTGIWCGYGIAALLTIMALAISVRAARMKTTYERRAYNKWWVYAGVFLVTIGFAQFGPAYLVERQAVKTYELPSTSIAPSFMPGDYVVADQTNKAVRSVKRGDVIAFTPNSPSRGVFAAGIVAGPGDNIALRDGRPIVNGEAPEHIEAGDLTLQDFNDDQTTVARERVPWHGVAYSHLITRREARAKRRSAPAGTLGPDEFFVMGNNRENAQDSFTSYGAIRHDQILGVITGTYWPL